MLPSHRRIFVRRCCHLGSRRESYRAATEQLRTESLLGGQSFSSGVSNRRGAFTSCAASPAQRVWLWRLFTLREYNFVLFHRPFIILDFLHQTRLKTLAQKCSNRASFMTYQRQFGAIDDRGFKRAASRRDDPIRIVILRPANGRRTSLRFRSCRFSSCPLASANAEARTISLAVAAAATRHSSIAASFLIDTLPTRITCKSFACIAGARSNRHSSGPNDLHSRNTGPHREGAVAL